MQLHLQSVACLCLYALTAGKVFRTAAPLKATEEDVRRLYNDLSIKDLVGFRGRL